jgi:hypothetical protein
VSQHGKSEFLGHLEGGQWFQGRSCVRKHGRNLNCRGTLGVESLYIATLPVLVAVDLHPIDRPHLSHKLHLACSSSCGSRHTIPLYENTCASQDALRLAVLEEHTNIDSGVWASSAEHHSCTACDHVQLRTGVWQACCEKLRSINGNEREKSVQTNVTAHQSPLDEMVDPTKLLAFWLTTERSQMVVQLTTPGKPNGRGPKLVGHSGSG